MILDLVQLNQVDALVGLIVLCIFEVDSNTNHLLYLRS